MLIDWLTARVPLSRFSAQDWEKLRGLGDRIQRFNPQTAEQVWETMA